MIVFAELHELAFGVGGKRDRSVATQVSLNWPITVGLRFYPARTIGSACIANTHSRFVRLGRLYSPNAHLLTGVAADFQNSQFVYGLDPSGKGFDASELTLLFK